VDGRGVWIEANKIAMIGNFKKGEEHGNFIGINVSGRMSNWSAA